MQYSKNVFIILLSRCLLVQSVNPPLDMNEFNHELDVEFVQMDTDQNNLVSEPEMEAYVLKLDYDRNGCISFVEFMRGRIHDTLKYSWALFNHFDHNDDDCLESWDLIEEFNEIDISPQDGSFTLAEFEDYYDKLYTKMGLPMTVSSSDIL